MKIKIKKLHSDAVIPKYATSGASGFDFIALKDIYVNPGETVSVRTGLAMEVSAGYEIQVRPRSGLSLKTDLRISNAPGTVDSDFRGEICVIMTNISRATTAPGMWPKGYRIYKGDRIAQGVICPVVQAEFIEDELTETDRGSGCFGSTGNK